MKKLIIMLFATVGLLSAASAWAYYTDNCNVANNYCGGGVYRCDIYCVGTNLDHDYCNRYCGGYNDYSYSNNTSCYYDAWGTYRCGGMYNSYNSYNYYNSYNSYYPIGYLRSYYWWSQEDLDLMTRSLNSDSINAAKAPDFFDTKIIRKDNNWKKLEVISIKNFTFKAEDMKEKFDDSKKFVTALKEAIWQRYSDGIIGSYQMADIIQNLTDTVYNLNKHFEYSKQYEKGKNDMYNDLAMEKLDEVKTNYDRLKASLKFGY